MKIYRKIYSREKITLYRHEIGTGFSILLLIKKNITDNIGTKRSDMGNNDLERKVQRLMTPDVHNGVLNGRLL